MRAPPYLAFCLSSFEHPSPMPIQISLSPDHLLQEFRSFRAFPLRTHTQRWRHRFLFDVLPLYTPPPRSDHECKACFTSSSVLACASCSISLWLVLTRVYSVFFSPLIDIPELKSLKLMSTPLSPALPVCSHDFRAIPVFAASASLINNSLSLSHLTWFPPLLSLIA